MKKKTVTKKIDEQMFIELFNAGKDDIDLAKLFGVAERTIQRYGAQLRKKGKIKLRKNLPSSRTTTRISSDLKEIKPINWKIAKPSNKVLPNKSFSTYLVVADTHVPYENEVAVKSILKLMDDVRFDGFIILGDYIDMRPISHWLKHKRKTLENQRMKQDYIEGNRLLDEFDKRLAKNCDKRFFYGNHENWYFNLIEEMPALDGLLHPTEELKLKERGYTVYEKINHIERIGRLNFTHGIYTSQNYVKKHIDELKSNVMFGHLHSPRMRLACSPAREIAIAGYCLGSLCNMSPSYMHGRPDKWAHGFGIVYFYENGFFDADLKRIVKGKFVYNNRLYDGNV